jgi:ribosomal protein S27AE
MKHRKSIKQCPNCCAMAFSYRGLIFRSCVFFDEPARWYRCAKCGYEQFVDGLPHPRSHGKDSNL